MRIFSDKCLSEKNFLVTGASSGIGRVASLLISACGGRVVAAGRDIHRLEALRIELNSSAEHVINNFDLRDADSTASWIEDMAVAHGPFSGIFHAAGLEMIRPIRMTKQSQLEAVFSSSLHAAFGISRAASRKNVMLDGGSMVFMSSVAALKGQRGLAAYASAKAGIDGMIRVLASEFSSRRIRINSIAAGAVDTPMHKRAIASSGMDAEVAYANAHPLGIGEPLDVANAAVFLLSDASKWITGTTLVVDGGYTA